jgi:DNA-binding response OmpR family regulator
MQRRVLEILLLRRGSVVSIETLMSLLYANNPDPPFDPVIKVLVSHLRKALRNHRAPITIKTIWGGGYMLETGAPR